MDGRTDGWMDGWCYNIIILLFWIDLGRCLLYLFASPRRFPIPTCRSLKKFLNIERVSTVIRPKDSRCCDSASESKEPSRDGRKKTRSRIDIEVGYNR